MSHQLSDSKKQRDTLISQKNSLQEEIIKIEQAKNKAIEDMRRYLQEIEEAL